MPPMTRASPSHSPQSHRCLAHGAFGSSSVVTFAPAPLSGCSALANTQSARLRGACAATERGRIDRTATAAVVRVGVRPATHPFIVVAFTCAISSRTRKVVCGWTSSLAESLPAPLLCCSGRVEERGKGKGATKGASPLQKPAEMDGERMMIGGGTTASATAALEFEGATGLRTILALSTVSGRAVVVRGIRERERRPGLAPHEACLLRLLEKITNGTRVEINETGTWLRYVPGVAVGGRVDHDCGRARAIGYFVEPLLLVSLFGKRPLTATLRGITNDDVDVGVDAWRAVTLPMLRAFGIGAESGGMDKPAELTVRRRGLRPRGGGEVVLHCPVVRRIDAVRLLDEGMVRRVRGVAFAAHTPPHTAQRLISGARGVLNALLSDVHIFVDADRHRGVSDGPPSPGFGVTLIAESTSGARLVAEAASHPPGGEAPPDLPLGAKGEAGEGGAATMPEGVGERAARLLLSEVARGGVVDASHQGLALVLCALSHRDSLSQVRLGPLTRHAVHVLRLIRALVGVTFKITPEQTTRTLFCSCMGAGIENHAKAGN